MNKRNVKSVCAVYGILGLLSSTPFSASLKLFPCTGWLYQWPAVYGAPSNLSLWCLAGRVPWSFPTSSWSVKSCWSLRVSSTLVFWRGSSSLCTHSAKSFSRNRCAFSPCPFNPHFVFFIWHSTCASCTTKVFKRYQKCPCDCITAQSAPSRALGTFNLRLFMTNPYYPDNFAITDQMSAPSWVHGPALSWLIRPKDTRETNFRT